MLNWDMNLTVLSTLFILTYGIIEEFLKQHMGVH